MTKSKQNSDDLHENALEAIRAVFGDQSVGQSEYKRNSNAYGSK